MPEESKKNGCSKKKNKSDAKEQRKPRQSRRNAALNFQNNEPKPETPKVSVSITPQNPVSEEPGPEFYNSLKRETDEILKITESEQSKYKNKEIQSNWAKYELPIESYDDFNEQANMGADYEKLTETPFSIGGHFQFKHEKSWDLNTGPSLYDHYFEIDMNNLATAIQTLSFYERNNIDKGLFTETDILSMENRSTKYKHKYYKNKTFITPELESHDKILNSLRSDCTDQIACTVIEGDSVADDMEHTVISTVTGEKKFSNENIQNTPNDFKSDSKIKDNELIGVKLVENMNDNIKGDKSSAKIIFETIETSTKEIESDGKVLDVSGDPFEDTTEAVANNKTPVLNKAEVDVVQPITKSINNTTQGEVKNPIIESPEDLEKWLNDFLDD